MLKIEKELPENEVKNKEHLESLESAKIIQQGLLPKERHFKRLFKESFVTYIPQNIVSGDFYWVGQRHNLRYLVVGDCTGHGVSAALLSVLAINIFEYAIMNKRIKKTNKILQEVDKKFIESFKNTSESLFDNPWIDVSVICIDDLEQKIYFSSAHRKLLIASSKEEYVLYKGSNYPIGGWRLENNRSFEAISIDYQEGDIIYLGSDGFQDQIGGIKDKKFSSKRLHQLLVENSQLNMEKQKSELEDSFNKWKKNELQLDDVCVVGARL